jgi:hypothetical protein
MRGGGAGGGAGGELGDAKSKAERQAQNGRRQHDQTEKAMSDGAVTHLLVVPVAFLPVLRAEHTTTTR